jgi:prophage regulatory protein
MEQKTILNLEELSKYTGWSKSYIYKKTSDGTLQFSKPLGKTIFFAKEWIDKFLLSKPNTTMEELETKASTIVTLKQQSKGGLTK